MSSLSERGIECLDIGGGRGSLVLSMARRFPKSSFCNIDFSAEALEVGRKEMQRLGLTNVSFFQEDACQLPIDWASKFNYITIIDLLHDVSSPLKSAQEAWRVLKGGGYLSVVDILVSSDQRVNAREEKLFILYTYSLFYCMSQSLAVEGSSGLGTCAGMEKICSILKEAKFEHIRKGFLHHNVHFLCQK